MHEIEKVSLNTLELLFDYLLQNNAEKIVYDFGEISHTNGVGTSFLKPKNPLFKFFWISQKNEKIEAIGFGGPNLGITLNELYSSYSFYKEGFIPYDDAYRYTFYNGSDYKYAICITSKNKLMKGDQMIENIAINSLGIYARTY